MVTLQRKRKRSRSVILALLPALIFIFVMGWCIYWIGDGKTNKKIQYKPRQENVTFLPIVYEEKQEITNE